jgi:hypothetical protein
MRRKLGLLLMGILLVENTFIPVVANTCDIDNNINVPCGINGKKYSDLGGTCIQCSNGTYSVFGKFGQGCILCPAGKRVSDVLEMEKRKQHVEEQTKYLNNPSCDAIFFENLPMFELIIEDIWCKICPKDFYNSDIGQDYCKQCPPRMTTESTGSTGSVHDMCKCLPPYFENFGGTCDVCPDNMATTANSTTCVCQTALVDGACPSNTRCSSGMKQSIASGTTAPNASCVMCRESCDIGNHLGDLTTVLAPHKSECVTDPPCVQCKGDNIFRTCSKYGSIDTSVNLPTSVQISQTRFHPIACDINTYSADTLRAVANPPLFQTQVTDPVNIFLVNVDASLGLTVSQRQLLFVELGHVGDIVTSKLLEVQLENLNPLIFVTAFYLFNRNDAIVVDSQLGFTKYAYESVQEYSSAQTTVVLNSAGWSETIPGSTLNSNFRPYCIAVPFLMAECTCCTHAYCVIHTTSGQAHLVQLNLDDSCAPPTPYARNDSGWILGVSFLRYPSKTHFYILNHLNPSILKLLAG